MSRAARMPAPAQVSLAPTAAPLMRTVKQNELLSPTSAAIVHASEQRAAKPGEVATGTLRIKVIQVTDLPGSSADNGHASSSLWHRYQARRHSANGKSKASQALGSVPFDSMCVLLKMASSSRTLATSAVKRGEAVYWNEDFFFEDVSTNDELRLVCIDRSKNEPYFNLPLRSDDSVTSSPGFIGKVSVPLIRLPEAEEIEQWYSLAPKESYLSLRTALRVSVCFTPAGGRARSARAESSVMVRGHRPPPLTMTQFNKDDPIHTMALPPPSPQGSTPQALTLSTGIVDYAIVVGPQDGGDANAENAMLFRYPAADRKGFPLPTKIEWFCFPGGPEVVDNVDTRPRSKLFSFVLVGGDDGLSRCYAVCVMVYHRPRNSQSSNVWQATCIAFLTRLPLLEELSTCLLSFTSTWLASSSHRSSSTDDGRFEAERLLVDLCHGVLTPVRGILGVQLTLPVVGNVRLVLPTDMTIYATVHGSDSHQNGATHNRIAALKRQTSSTSAIISASNGSHHHLTHRGSKMSPTKSHSVTSLSVLDFRVSFQPLVYSLRPLFEHFDVKSILEITALMLCEYRLLIHSTQMSVLCPIAEGLCTLIYPFRWQHPYIPILPNVLCEYLQAPLPYVLGVHSSWIPDLLENGRPEHLVIVDVDRGSIQRHDSGPVLPPRLSRALRRRVNAILYPEMFDSLSGDDSQSSRSSIAWNDRIERLVRGEFACFLATMLKGYRDCLFFVNQKLPVFNKRRFFASHAAENEATPFLTRLFSTQAFQGFLENHDAPELNVFHAVYMALLRGSELVAWPQSCPPCLELPVSGQDANTKEKERLTGNTPVYVMPVDVVEICENYDASTSRGERLQSHEAQRVLGQRLERALDNSADVSELLGIRNGGGLSLEAMDMRYAELMNRSVDYHDIADALGVDHKLLEEHSDWLKRPHAVNQHQIISSSHGHASSTTALMASAIQNQSKDEERMEQLLHKCLTSVFTSDDQLTQDELRACEARFKNQYARDLFVLILMQPSQQYIENLNSAMASTWYNPKGSGSCIGEPGFQLLVRMSAALMDQCATHEDFTNARGMLQVSAQYYHFVEDKHSGIGFAKKEYLVQTLRLRPICRSLDMWQHAFSKEIDAALLASGGDAAASVSSDVNEPATSVSDEVFFSVIGSLVYDMLTVDVPVGNVQTFVTVMCSTYQKDRELRETLKQLVENVFRAVELSKDAAPNGQSQSQNHIHSKTPVAQDAVHPTPMSQVSPPPASRTQYDLDTVIRRKMSVQDPPFPSSARRPPPSSQDSKAGTVTTPTSTSSASSAAHRRRDATNSMNGSSSLLLSTQNSPVLSLSVFLGRVACGTAESYVSLLDSSPLSPSSSSSDKRGGLVITKLEGHSDAVVAVAMQGQTLISGSRDHTLRAWDLKASPKKRHHLFGFLSSSSSHSDVGNSNGAAITTSGSGELLDGAVVSRKSLVLKGHSGPVTCVEIGRQLSTDRAIAASGSMDSTIRLWDTSKEHSVAVLGTATANSSGSSGANSRVGNGVSCLRYLAHFDNLVSGYYGDFTLKAWDLGSSKMRSCVPAHRGAIRDIQITGDRLVTAANDRVAKVWDARFRDGANYSHALRGHGGPVLCLSLGGPADPNICTGAADGVVRVWDLRYVQKGPRLALLGHGGPVTCLQRDFTRLVSGSEDGTLRVWDMHSGVCLKDIRAHQSGVTCMALQGSSVYSGSWDGAVRVWDIEVATLRT